MECVSSRWCCSAPEITRCASSTLNVPFSGDGEYIHFSLDEVCVFAVSLWTHCALVCIAGSSQRAWTGFLSNKLNQMMQFNSSPEHPLVVRIP